MYCSIDGTLIKNISFSRGYISEFKTCSKSEILLYCDCWKTCWEDLVSMFYDKKKNLDTTEYPES